MEGGDQNHGNGGSRWNPTKEQISMLESLYRQGLRTPTAEQIQQITSRLRDFGHIEGKNVFYWFQNHKARQRQKQKQESFAYYNRFLHHATPVFPPYHNVVCSPCYIPPPRNDQMFYQQYPKVPLPTAAASFKRSRLKIPEIKQNPTCQRYNPTPSSSMEHDLQFICSAKHSSSHQETLDLFPIHPTGILQSRNIGFHDQNHENKNPISSCAAAETPSISTASTENNERDHHGDIYNGCDDDNHDGGGGGGHPFFDFFCGN